MNIERLILLRAFRPGDCVFVETTKPLKPGDVEALTQRFENFLPGIKVVLLEPGWRVHGHSEHEAQAHELSSS